MLFEESNSEIELGHCNEYHKMHLKVPVFITVYFS